MKRQLLVKTLAAAAAVLAAFSASARVVVDHLDRKVEVPDHVNRVVITNIFPFASVTAVFLGGADKIAGMSKVSMLAAENGLLGEIYPKIKKVPTNFMNGSTVNVESLMKLRPDVVFVNAGDAKTLKMLDNAGIPALAVSVNRWNYNVLDTYEAWIKLLDEVFPGQAKKEKAARISRSVASMVSRRVASIPASQRRRLLFLFQYDDRKIVTSGRRFFGQYWADAVGAQNVASGVKAENANAQINMEQVYRWNPDTVLITNFTNTVPADLYGSKFHDWSKVKAVQERRVYKMPLGLYRGYTPSADTPMTLLWLAKTVYPERFRDVNLNAEVKKYYRELFNIRLTDRQVESIFRPKSNVAEGRITSPAARGR
ncbi:ABC transporter substrate-binding protein [Mesosutterella sp. AGMB02718]|uniref:ABC transporter substrate-binding protein n=1 Tax=Mesosutterella faecium TaxID=2925194 RepID=A0ABT7IPC6_9BURK|nr:ABC transporter substrate-binding protein [Mesosutterella sp. AGMB02718]MDL2060233.1 ABC transporter substrate-binding protein [Mesosutterella sp. AGMB02718]